MGKITEARLRDVARTTADKVVCEMARRLEGPLPEDALQCEFLGTQKEDAPLNSRTRILFE